MRRLLLYLSFGLLLTLIKSNTVPIADATKQQTASTIIYGVVPEDVQSLQPVVVSPPILASDYSHEVCEYKLEHHPNDEEGRGALDPTPANTSIPFRVVLQDKKTGSALLIVSEGSQLDYETASHYELNLLTVFCDGSIPVARQRMSIRVTDINEFAPEWREQGYLAEVEEGRLYDPLLKVEATDRDGSDLCSRICHYKLVTEGVPFVLDNRGYLRNTEPLVYEQRHNFILEVVAEDCGGLSSEKGFVNILIVEKCRPGWKGLKSEKTYVLPSRGPSLLMSSGDASLQLCNLAENCTVDQVTVGLRLLKTNSSTGDGIESDEVFSTEIDSTCDLDSRSVGKRLEMCESDLGMVDLLNPGVIGSNATGDRASDWLIFDGSSAFDVPTSRLRDDIYKDYIVRDESDDNDSNDADSKSVGDSEKKRKKVETFVMTRDGPNSKFTISVWMRRDYGDAVSKEGKEEKQSILCSSDGEGMNRNHVSLFLHNCHLVMLARFEPSGRHLRDVLGKTKKRSGSKSSSSSDSSEEVAMDSPERNEDDEFYRPSEWHWKLEQTCDGKWHHYAINVEQGKARLFVDGNLFINTPRNPVTLEDHALHLSKKVHSTKLTVGACWKGLTQTYGDHFRGQLAELRLLRRSVLKETTIKCVSNCNEKLDFHSINEMESGMSISMNSQMTELTINGRTKASVEHLLSTVGYTNPKTKWSPEEEGGALPSVITFQTSLKCADEMTSRFVSKETMKIRLAPSEDEPRTPSDPSSPTKEDPGDSSLFISGTQRLDYAERDVGRGVRVFKDVVIYRYPVEKDLSYQELIKEQPKQHKEVESCTVRVSPAMDEEVEDIIHPQAIAYKKHLRVDTSLEGLVIKGPGKAVDFVELLQKISYIHKRSGDLNKKIFALFCHDGEGKKSKDDLVVELNTIHYEYPDESQWAGHLGQDKFMHPVAGRPLRGNGLVVSELSEGASKESRTGNASVVATITACVCVLMVVISVGTYRVFFRRPKTVKVHVDNQQEPRWDRSTITITVNPLETAALKEEEPSEKEATEDAPALLSTGDNYYDDDDDIGSAHEMMRDTEEEEEDEEGRDGGGDKKKYKYSDEDASKINHFVLSDTE